MSASRPLKIALVVHGLPPSATAGVEVYTSRLAEALAEQGQEVLILTAKSTLAHSAYTTERLKRKNVAIIEIASHSQRASFEETYQDARIDRIAQGVLSEFRPDIVHIQHLQGLSIGIVSVARSLGARIVMTLHDYSLSCARGGLRMQPETILCERVDDETCADCLKSAPQLATRGEHLLVNSLRRWRVGRGAQRAYARWPRLGAKMLGLLRRLPSTGVAVTAEQVAQRRQGLAAMIRDVDLFLAPTEFMAARAVDTGVREELLRVIPLGVATAKAQARRAIVRRRVGFMGVIAPHKGVHILIDAFQKVRCDEATLDIYGSERAHPAYADALHRQARADARIHIHGAFQEGEQARILAQLDLIVLPSLWWENSPMVVIEALAFGLPVIVTRTGGMVELVREGETGLVVPAGDPEALQQAIEAVVTGRSLTEAHAALPLKTIADEAQELCRMYRGLLGATEGGSA
ncbi:MAG: glycosyltransferase [Vicinamibacteria bacterium]|nr:glycosyltransferase [Vicinamibacteria bacterium]